MRQLTMLVGIPGSGKSTLREALFQKDPDAFVVSFDDIRERVLSAEPEETAHQNLKRKLRDARFELYKEIRHSDRNVILDATCLTEEIRRSILGEMNTKFDKKTAIWVDTPLDTALQRNDARARVVPEEVILRMSGKLEIPKAEEGFSEIFRYESKSKTMTKMDEDKTVRVFVDMDGVVANFEKAVKDAGIPVLEQGVKHTSKEVDEFWTRLGEIPHFYETLSPIDEGVNMVNELKNAGLHVSFLTGIPLVKGNMATAQVDKIKWAKRIFGDDVRVYPVMRKNKCRFCEGPNSILIDDFAKTIDEWTGCGGSGYVYKDNAEEITKSIIQKEKVIEKQQRKNSSIHELINHCKDEIKEDKQKISDDSERSAAVNDTVKDTIKDGEVR